MGHAKVPEVMEVSAIVHFLSEDVGRIDFPGHMLDLESFVLDPLADRVLTEFNALRRFGVHVKGPPDAFIIVVIEDCGSIKRGKSVSCIREAAGEITEVNNLLSWLRESWPRKNSGRYVPDGSQANQSGPRS
jgi:hypothetical protein